MTCTEDAKEVAPTVQLYCLIQDEPSDNFKTHSQDGHSHYTWTIQDDDCKALHLSVQLLLFFENLVLLF